VLDKTEADGTPHQFSYDPIYRLAQVVNNVRVDQPRNNDTNVTTNYRYDANGNLITTTDANTYTTNFAFDPLDRLSAEINPLGNAWNYSYDHEQNLIKRTDANGGETKYGYSPDNILAEVAYPSHTVKYNYSETNFPLTMQDNLGTTTWQYDDLDRLTNQLDPLNRALAYDYDLVGNLAKIKYPDGRGMTHQYLKNDWLKESQALSFQSGGPETIAFTRNKVGAPTNIKHSNSSISNILYDKVYRQLEVFDQQQGSGSHLISKFSYTYNDVGHQTEEVAEYGWRQPAKVSTAFKYDGLHRLTQAQSDDNQKSQYVYDPVGNRITMIEQLKQGPETRNYSFNAANQVTQVAVSSSLPPNNLTTNFSYDKNGNRVNKLIVDATGLDRGSEYRYDFENRLTKIEEYHYQLSAALEPTPLLSPTPTDIPQPTSTPTPTPTPATTASPCPGNGNGKNNGKYDCNNGGGNYNKTGTLMASTSPEPTVTPAPIATSLPNALSTPSPTATTENQPTIAPENNVSTLASTNSVKNYLADTKLEYDGNGRRLVSTYSPGNSQNLKRTEFAFDRLDAVAEYSMWNGQRNNLYRTTRNPVTRSVQPADPMHSQFTLNAANQGSDLAFFQEFKSENDPNGTEYWYHYDGEGNIAGTTKHKAQSDHTYRYDEYGLTLSDNGVGLGQVGSQNNSGNSGWGEGHNNYTLTQKYFDPNSSLVYFGSRHYDPEMGVWLTQDNYRGEAQTPTSLHRYLYNYVSPVNYQDLYGYEPNQTQIGTADQWVRWVESEESKLGSNPNTEDRRRMLKNISDQIVSDVNKTDTLPFEVEILGEKYDNRVDIYARYVYSENYGNDNPQSHYMDGLHFFAGAYYSSARIGGVPFPGKKGTKILGWGKEASQIFGNQSFLSPEDFASNNSGIDFGKYVDLSKPLAPQLKQFLVDNVKVYPYLDGKNQYCPSPEFYSLPKTDQRTYLQAIGLGKVESWWKNRK